MKNGVFRPELSVVGIPVSDCDNNMHTLHGGFESNLRFSWLDYELESYYDD